MPDDLIIHREALRELQHSDEMRDLIGRAADLVADNARDLAPGPTGARSHREGIVTETVRTGEGWEGHIGHVVGEYGFWLARQELGTRFQRPQPHLRPAASEPIDL